MITDLIKIYERDLDRLKLEIELFNNESKLWSITGSVKNSAGNLSLHLVGNLKTYIGKNLGQIHYVRDRDAEFSLKNVPKQSLLEQIEETKTIVLSSLEKLNTEDFSSTYPENVFGYEMTNGFFLLHLAAHLSYHLGQINYIRRVLE
jgi:hypothetical protein